MLLALKIWKTCNSLILRRLQTSDPLKSLRFTYWLPQIFCTSNPSCTIVLSFLVAFQMLRWLVDVWYRPSLDISSRHHCACFCWWHLQNCFGNCGDLSRNRHSSYFPDDLRNHDKKKKLQQTIIPSWPVHWPYIMCSQSSDENIVDIPLSQALIFFYQLLVRRFKFTIIIVKFVKTFIYLLCHLN